MDSILLSVKKLLGIAEEYNHFDSDIIIHINSVLMSLTQMGIGPENGFIVEGEEDLWSEFIPDKRYLEAVKSYVYFKVRFMFDPPTTSSVAEALRQSMQELEWRLAEAAENIKLQYGGETSE